MKASYLLILLVILFPILLFFMTRGVVMHDEGFILHSAEKITRGILPYRDFDFADTPLSIYATAFSFLILQPSIFSSRVLMLIVAMVSILLIYKIIIFATRNKFYATLGVAVFAAWGPTHINFALPVMFALVLSLTTLYLLLKFLDTRSERFLFLAGLAAFSVFLAKQNFGIAILFPLMSLFLVKNMRKLSYYLTFSNGYLWGFIVFALILLLNDSFAPFVTNFYDYTIKSILIHEWSSTGLIYKDSIVSMLLRTTFYLLPLFISVISFVILFVRRRFHLLFLPVFVLFFYLFGIQPTTDFVHLVPLVSLLGIPISLFLRYNILSTLRFFAIFLSLILIIIGFQTALYKGYYESDSPLVKHDNFYRNSRVNIFLDDKFKDEFNQFLSISNNYTNKKDYIFVTSSSPMLYFITQRFEPTKSNHLKNSFDRREYYKEVVGNLVAKNVRLIILDKNSLNLLPIRNYILTNYKFLITIYNFDIYVRNP